jgi:transcriptional regulator with XRE-family HTH domain
MSPKDLADALETTVQQVQQWEAGTSRIGSTRLMKLTKILGVNAAFFFADSEPDEPKRRNRIERNGDEFPRSGGIDGVFVPRRMRFLGAVPSPALLAASLRASNGGGVKIISWPAIEEDFESVPTSHSWP